jgi:hypothetical protein
MTPALQQLRDAKKPHLPKRLTTPVPASRSDQVNLSAQQSPTTLPADTPIPSAHASATTHKAKSRSRNSTPGR